jgi:hypothetical protein
MCAGCHRRIPDHYEPKITAAGPMHPGCYRRTLGLPRKGAWDIR